MTSDNTVLNMTAVFPGASNNIIAANSQGLACGILDAVVTMTTNTGLVLNADFTTLSAADPSHPTLANSFKWTTGRGSFTEASQATASGLSAEVRPQVASLTRKPDTGILYGLLHDGTIVEVNAATGDYIQLTGSCPFTTCTIPVWIQSITAGAADSLYGLDHGGTFYKIVSASNLEPTAFSFPDYVRQVTID
jgi:hypothetical protein